MTTRRPSGLMVLGGLVVIGLCFIAGVMVGPTLVSALTALLPKPGAAHDGAHDASDSAKSTWYISQMHPHIIQQGPGTCPICGMDLTPIDPQRFAGEIAIDPVTVQNIGVRSQIVEQGQLTQTFRAAAVVAWDPGRVTQVVQRTSGWITETPLKAAGDRVQAGDPLFVVSSPDLYSAQVDWLQAHGARARTGGESALAAASVRLRFLGITEFDYLLTEGPRESVAVTAPVTGVALTREVQPGARVEAGMTLATVVADDEVWVMATVYPRQLAQIHQQTAATVVLADGQRFPAEVALIEPEVDPVTRAARVRLTVANDNGQLRAGSAVAVEFVRHSDENYILIPRSAVVGTEPRQVVFVSRGRGRFEPRTVTLGPTGDHQMVAVTQGLNRGEAVVVTGQFLLDSEARMREALLRTIYDGLPNQEPITQAQPVAAEHTAHTQPSTEQAVPRTPAVVDHPPAPPVSAPAAEHSLGPVLAAYLPLVDLLYAGDLAATRSAAAKLTAAARGLNDGTAMVEAAAAIEAAQELIPARAALGQIGILIRDAVRQHGRPAGYDDLHVLTCGMYRHAPERGVWLQTNGREVTNPFFGERAAMRDCAISVEPLQRIEP